MPTLTPNILNSLGNFESKFRIDHVIQQQNPKITTFIQRIYPSSKTGDSRFIGDAMHRIVTWNEPNNESSVYSSQINASFEILGRISKGKEGIKNYNAVKKVINETNKTYSNSLYCAIDVLKKDTKWFGVSCHRYTSTLVSNQNDEKIIQEMLNVAQPIGEMIAKIKP